MARVLCSSTFRSALTDGVANLIKRRGFAAASAAAGRRHVEEKAAGKRKAAAEAAAAWVPDPVTGYYRPANRPWEMDAAEMREMLLSHKSRD